ncbi:hypothetical protein EDD66_103147 [Mobilisporobacter senegalensis]|uniref:Uncharacterized protein n=1 Tax=Mobilisporobacter senegalensis TaxID=1329262 RepID=A0A3N1XST9_9FIRM|nr:hypothetical protein [Mobilisporobacter senegalensis]ROR29211.1 hypothetical protein EDD66_103147 [Mobilisporobacter senegalensis]
MNEKTNLKLYNVIFPIWLLWLFPMTWLVILPSNFLIDTIVVLITLKVLKLSGQGIYKKIIFKVWGFGFLSDFIGTFIMFSPSLIDGFLDYESPMGKWWYENLTNAVSYNPFESIFSFLWVTFAIIITSLFIYIFNYKISLRKVEIENALKKKIALSIAIFTAPFFFYLPTKWFY